MPEKNLKQIIASLAILNQKLNNIHFNYTGKDFLQIHTLTDSLYHKVFELYDNFAEKLRSFDQKVPASATENLKLSFIKELSGEDFNLDLKGVITEITNDLELFLTSISVTDAKVQPLVDELVLIFHKHIWLFKSFI